MPTKIKRGQSLLIPFKDGQTIYDSQNKPRMYLTRKAFEKSFPRHLIAREGVELVEYAEVVRCKDCKHWGIGCGGETKHIKACCFASYMVGENGYCVYGERKIDAEVQDGKA